MNEANLEFLETGSGADQGMVNWEASQPPLINQKMKISVKMAKMTMTLIKV